MQADTNPMLQRHAPLWQRLRDWLATARHEHADSLEYLSRKQLIPLRRWLSLLEATLRRLILLAASTTKTDITARWSRPEKPVALIAAEPEPEPDAPEPEPAPPAPRNTSSFRFRLYGITWPRQQRTMRPATAASASALTIATSHKPFIIRINLAPDGLLHVGARPKRTKRTASRRSTTKRVRNPRTPPDLTVEEFEAWLSAQLPVDWAEKGRQLWREMMELAPRPEHNASCANKPIPVSDEAQDPNVARCDEAAPDLIPTQPLLDRLAVIAELIENPQALIRRAARAFARRRELALRLASAAAPKASGILATSPLLFGTLIPLHAEFIEGMEYFAASYIECDTS